MSRIRTSQNPQSSSSALPSLPGAVGQCPQMSAISTAKMSEGVVKDDVPAEVVPDFDPNFRKRQQLISFGHSRWGFKNWNWSVTKQELDFVDYANGKYSAGVVAFVSVSVTSLGIHREDVGYATTVSHQKGSAIYNARKTSVTNALRETLLSFGGSIASQLMEQLESSKNEKQIDKRHYSDVSPDNDNSNVQSSSVGEPKNAFVNIPSKHSHRKDSSDSSVSGENNQTKTVKSPRHGNQNQGNKIGETSHNQLPNNNNLNSRVPPQTNSIETPSFPANQMATKPAGFVTNNIPKVVNPVNHQIPQAHSMISGNARPTPGPPQLASHHSSNVSYLVQHVMPPLYSVQCGTAHTPPPPLYHNAFYTEFPPWPLYDNYERHNKVNMNINMPPKNFTMNGRAGMMECQQSCGGRTPPMNGPDDSSIGTGNYIPHPININGAWIKPTIFYDGFWTEQKVKKWVTEQMDKPSMAEETRVSNSDHQKQMCHSKV